MNQKKLLNKIWQVILPIILGLAILVWTYKDFDFKRVWSVIEEGINYWWIVFSLVFGVFGHLFRGWRWNISLAPLNEYPKLSNSVYAIFVSYAANLVIPRIGEVSRCGILAKYDNISFSKSLGTVITERIIDSVCVIIITCTTLLIQSGIFVRFINETGTNTAFFVHLFTSTNFYITIACIIALLILAYLLFRRFSIFTRVKGIFNDIWQGCLSIKYIEKKYIFILYTIGIWLCYFLQFYVTFYSFDFTSDLGLMPGLVMFVVGSIAVIVPTPNGAGPWHFAIITMMMMYGISKDNAGIFALIVHGIQTFLLILLGIYGLVALPLSNKRLNKKTHN